MSGTITISIWFFILLILVFVLAVLDRILIPSTRWFLRRRIKRHQPLAVKYKIKKSIEYISLTLNHLIT
jgi:glycerol-3-phosphate O-acyltransferase